MSFHAGAAEGAGRRGADDEAPVSFGLVEDGSRAALKQPDQAFDAGDLFEVHGRTRFCGSEGVR